MTKRAAVVAVAVSLVLASATIAGADTITLSEDDLGWYRGDGWHIETLSTYAVGTNLHFPGPVLYENNGFFVFDVPVLNQPLVSATLRLHRYEQLGSIDIEFYDVDTAVGTLVSGHVEGNAEGQSIFQDLGAGTSYGQFTVPWTGSTTDVLEFSLNGSALADIASGAGGLIAIGATRTGGDVDHHGQNSLFGLSNASGVQELILVTIPEPSTALLLAAGLAGIAAAGRRRPLQ